MFKPSTIRRPPILSARLPGAVCVPWFAHHATSGDARRGSTPVRRRNRPIRRSPARRQGRQHCPDRECNVRVRGPFVCTGGVPAVHGYGAGTRRGRLHGTAPGPHLRQPHRRRPIRTSPRSQSWARLITKRLGSARQRDTPSTGRAGARSRLPNPETIEKRCAFYAAAGALLVKLVR
jgi:hypothetical protein